MKFSFSDCGGCRSCELACSFRWVGEFDITQSSVEIFEKPEGGYEVTLHETSAGMHKACDGCEGLDIPMCVRYCHSSEELQRQITELCKSRKEAQQNA